MDDAGLIERNARPAIQLDDARAAHALGEILVGRADDDAIHARIPSSDRRRGRERVVRLEFDHGPDDDAGRGEGFFEQVELCREDRVRSPSPVL